MNGKMKTISLQGKEYAQVKDRVKEFRAENPNGLINTTPTIQEDGQIIFKAHVVKDKANESSAEATGHALGKNNGQKAFEKLETIAVGRALALLGYGADGEIASGEEMEEFLAYKQEQDKRLEEEVLESIAQIKNTKTVEELKKFYLGLGTLTTDQRIINAKDTQYRLLMQGSVAEEKVKEIEAIQTMEELTNLFTEMSDAMKEDDKIIQAKDKKFKELNSVEEVKPKAKAKKK